MFFKKFQTVVLLPGVLVNKRSSLKSLISIRNVKLQKKLNKKKKRRQCIVHGMNLMHDNASGTYNMYYE